jgi:DNA-directed RNA polymerase specialized sigma24 family protein
VVARVGGRAVGAIREDVQQEVLIALWRQVESERSIEHPSSYIYRAAVRETVRAVRRERARQSEPLDGVEPVQEGSPQSLLAAREQAGHVEASLAALLPDRARAVRAHLAGFDVDEIMKLHGWTYQKARNLVARGMADLRESLLKKGVT